MRRFLLLLLALVILAIPAYAGLWLYVAHDLRQQLGPWAEAERAKGFDITWQQASVEGFPLAFRYHLTTVALRAPRPLPYAVTSPTILASAAPWNLHHWRYSAPDGIDLDLATLPTGLTAKRLDGTVNVTESGANAIAATAQGLVGEKRAAGFSARDAGFQLVAPAQPPASHHDPALNAAMTLDGAMLPRPVPGIGRAIETIALDASLLGRIPSGPLDPALAAWRDDGGTLEIKSARLAWGKASIDVNATLALDHNLQPEGAGSAVVDDPEQVIDAAVASGSLDPRFAGLVRSIIMVMSKPGAGGAHRVTLPLSIQNQQLYLGPARLAVLPSIRWDLAVPPEALSPPQALSPPAAVSPQPGEPVRPASPR